MGIPPELLGPTGLLVGALVVIGVLWRDHLRADAEDRRQRDVSTEGWQGQVGATNALAASVDKLARNNERLARAIEARNRRDARSRRSDDA